jgi:hypothetical protein
MWPPLACVRQVHMPFLLLAELDQPTALVQYVLHTTCHVAAAAHAMGSQACVHVNP